MYISNQEHLFAFCSFYGKLFAKERPVLMYTGDPPATVQRSENEKEQSKLKERENSGLYEAETEPKPDSQGRSELLTKSIPSHVRAT